AQATAEHLGAPALEPMAGEGLRVAVDASHRRGDVGQLPGRGHVTGLALLALTSGRAVEPFRVGTVHMHAKDDAFMTGGTVAALLIQWREDVFAAVHVGQRAEE